MPKQEYRIDPEGREKLLLEWEEPFKNVVVTVDKQRLGVFPDRAAFERGQSFSLTNGRTLSLRLLRTPTRAELLILVDGMPVPRYSVKYRPKGTSYSLALVGLSKVVFIAAPEAWSSLPVSSDWVGVPSLPLALLYLVLAVLRVPQVGGSPRPCPGDRAGRRPSGVRRVQVPGLRHFRHRFECDGGAAGDLGRTKGED
jgi:hypothetical protein